MTTLEEARERTEKILERLERFDNIVIKGSLRDVQKIKNSLKFGKRKLISVKKYLSNAQSCDSVISQLLDSGDNYFDALDDVILSDAIDPSVHSLYAEFSELYDEVSDYFTPSESEVVTFYFKIKEKNKSINRAIRFEHDNSEKNYFSNLLDDRKTEGKTLELLSMTVLPDPKLYILREYSDQDSSKFVYFVALQGKKIVEIQPNTATTPYDIELKPFKNDFLQPSNLVYELENPAKDVIVVRIDNHFKSGNDEEVLHVVKAGTASEIANLLKQLTPKTIKVVIRNQNQDNSDDNGVSVSFDENLLNSLYLKRLNPDNTVGSPIPLTNFMWFQIESSKVAESLYNCLRAELTKTGKRQLETVRKHLMKLSDICSSGQNVYARFVGLVQSSGFGKTKICLELLSTQPGSYLVFRAPGQTGVPRSAGWMNKFADFIFGAEFDEMPVEVDEFLNAIADEYTPGRFLIALFTLLENQKLHLRKLIGPDPNSEKVAAALKVLASVYLKKPSSKEQESVTIDFPEGLTMNISELQEKIHSSVTEILEMTGSPGPYLLFLDEADVLSSRNAKGRLSGINVVRRGLHLLNSDTNILTVAIGTNSDALDLTPSVQDNSLRYIDRKYILSPFFLTNNWDIMSEDLKLESLVMTRNLLLNRTYFNVLVTMGRALWSSIKLGLMVSFASQKLKNGCGTCVAALVARLLVRANLHVNVHHVLSRSLVKSYMIIVNYISTDARTMKLSYSSEPILAFGARTLLQGHQARENSFRALKHMLEHGAIEKGRIVEFIFEQLSLFTIDDANMQDDRTVSFKDSVNDDIPTDLKGICGVKTQILSLKTEDDPPPKSTLPSSDVLQNVYRVISVRLYLRTKFSKEICDIIEQSLNPSVLNGLMNASQFIQLEHADAEDFPDFKSHRGSGSSRRIIDRSLLNCGLMRFCGYVMPPGYFGIDFIIPIILHDPNKEYPRDVFSFIAFQSKTSRPSNLDDCSRKMVASRHLLRCPNPMHKEEKTCKLNNCSASYTAAEIDFINQNQVTFLLSARNDIKEGLPSVKISMKSENLDEFRIKMRAKRKRSEAHEKLSEKERKKEETDFEKQLKLDFRDQVIAKAAEYTTTELSTETNVSVSNYPNFTDDDDDDQRDSLPDFISHKRINQNIMLQRMVWKRRNRKSENHQSVLCIALSGLNAFEKIVGPNALALLEEIIDLNTSNLHSVEPIHLPVVRDSLLNGTFSPYEEMNPLLRKMRGLAELADPLAGYHEQALNRDSWEKSVNEAARGIINTDITVDHKTIAAPGTATTPTAISSNATKSGADADVILKSDKEMEMIEGEDEEGKEHDEGIDRKRQKII